MEKRSPETPTASRPRERGAALLLVLMFSLLLLLVGGALITSTMMSATNMLDATPEVQAYYGSEAGLQAALLALRGDSAPNPVFATDPPGGVADQNKLDFRGAVTNSVSNLAGDPASPFPARLSRWLQYNYPAAGFADRVVVSPAAGAYSPLSGIAYSLIVRDPDNSQNVTYSTSGTFNNGSNVYPLSGTGVTNAALTYNAQGSTTVTAYPTATAQGLALGSFTISGTGSGTVSIPGGTQLTLRVAVASPYGGYMLMGGLLSGSVTFVSSVPTASTLQIKFGNVSVRVRGTLFALADYNTGAAANPYSIGASPSPYPMRVAITAPNPERLLVTSTGYGPRGSRKMLTMEVNKFLYNIRPPAPIVVRGSDTAGDLATFDLGSSNSKYYTGKDHSNIQAQQPTVAISLQDWPVALAGMRQGSTYADPAVSILDLDPVPSPWVSPSPVPSTNPVGSQPAMPPSAQTPDFLQTADAARTFLNDVQSVAQTSGRYYTTLTGYADAGNDLANINNPALTFVDGDCTLDGGSGLLVVTGTLTLKGNDDFHGLILVMGGGTVIRSGAGNGNTYGSWIVARFPRTGTGGFTAPTFNVAGGGTGHFEFDTKAIDDALRMLGLRVVGVAET